MSQRGHAFQTRRGLACDLSRLGVQAGDIVLVHASLRSLGPVDGGATTVVRSLTDVLGARGTVVVPAMTADNSDPSRWPQTRGEAAPVDQWVALRAAMPAFDPGSTPSFRMGAVAEAVRTAPRAVRSDHPQTSFAALGRDAGALMADHDWRCHLGTRSPLGRLVEHEANVLLLGVGYDVCTAFHLAEYRLPAGQWREYECVVQRDGARQWFRYYDRQLDDSRFGELGQDFESARSGAVRRGRVGGADARLFPLPAAVDFAEGWLTR